ncbi:MAG TPA: single-stranded DNA-binding protein [Acidobacteriota bacterium]|nr:single-stranded DNA-binding protein [Acidobacteriota bacterium]
MSLNKILLIGHLGRDPEIRYTQTGKQITQFSMATSRRFKVEGELREETEWFSIVTFGRLAQICSEFLKKGRQVYIAGRVHTRNWTDAQGARHFRTDVIAEEMRLIGSRPNGADRNAAAEPADSDMQAEPDSGEE